MERRIRSNFNEIAEQTFDEIEFNIFINEPAHEIMVLITSATGEGSGEPAHPRSLICCSHTWSMEVDEESDQESDILPDWMAAHAQLKNEFTEDEKYHLIISWHGSNAFDFPPGLGIPVVRSRRKGCIWIHLVLKIPGHLKMAMSTRQLQTENPSIPAGTAELKYCQTYRI